MNEQTTRVVRCEKLCQDIRMKEKESKYRSEDFS